MELISVCPYCFEMKTDGGACDYCDQPSSEGELLEVTPAEYENGEKITQALKTAQGQVVTLEGDAAENAECVHTTRWYNSLVGGRGVNVYTMVESPVRMRGRQGQINFVPYGSAEVLHGGGRMPVAMLAHGASPIPDYEVSAIDSYFVLVMFNDGSEGIMNSADIISGKTAELKDDDAYATIGRLREAGIQFTMSTSNGVSTFNVKSAQAERTMTAEEFIDAVTLEAQRIFPFQWEWEFPGYGAHMVYLDGIEIAYSAGTYDGAGYTVTLSNVDDIFASGKILEEKSYGDIAFDYTPEEGEEPIGEVDNPVTYIEPFAKELAAAIKKYSTYKTAQFGDRDISEFSEMEAVEMLFGERDEYADGARDDAIEDAYNEGVYAKSYDNPYKRNTDLFDSWELGWADGPSAKTAQNEEQALGYGYDYNTEFSVFDDNSWEEAIPRCPKCDDTFTISYDPQTGVYDCGECGMAWRTKTAQSNARDAFFAIHDAYLQDVYDFYSFKTKLSDFVARNNVGDINDADYTLLDRIREAANDKELKECIKEIYDWFYDWFDSNKTAQFNNKFPVPSNKASLAVEALKILRFVAHQVGQHLPDGSPIDIADGIMSSKCYGQIWGSDNGWGGGDQSGVYIAWEDGPYDWVHGGRAIGEGIDMSDFPELKSIWNWELTDAPGLASWVRIEPVTNWMLAVYDDRTNY